MKRRFALIVTFALLVAQGIVAQSQPGHAGVNTTEVATAESQVIQDPEVYKVYTAVVTELTGHVIGKSSPAVVVLMTTVPVTRECFPKEKENRLSEAFQDFLQHNSEPPVLLGKLRFPKRYYLTTQAQIDKFSEAGPFDSEAFQKRFPGAEGIIDLSVVGFDGSKTHGMVRGRIYCGPLCGAARDYTLRKRGNQWHVASSQTCGGVS